MQSRIIVIGKLTVPRLDDLEQPESIGQGQAWTVRTTWVYELGSTAEYKSQAVPYLNAQVRPSWYAQRLLTLAFAAFPPTLTHHGYWTPLWPLV